MTKPTSKAKIPTPNIDKPTARASYETIFAIQDIDIQIVNYLTRHPEDIEFTVINKVYEKLDIPEGTFRDHVRKLKKYGILKAGLYLSEDTKELIDLVKRIGEDKEHSP